jgi:hypothetical protein
MARPTRLKCDEGYAEKNLAAKERKDHKNRRSQEEVSGMIVSGIIRNFLIPMTNTPLTLVSAEVQCFFCEPCFAAIPFPFVAKESRTPLQRPALRQTILPLTPDKQHN